MVLPLLFNILLAELFLYNIICPRVSDIAALDVSIWMLPMNKHEKVYRIFIWTIYKDFLNILTAIWVSANFVYHCALQKWMLPLLTVGLHSSATYMMVLACHLLCNPSIRYPLRQFQYLLSSGSSVVLLQMKYVSTRKTLKSCCTTTASHWFRFKSLMKEIIHCSF